MTERKVTVKKHHAEKPSKKPLENLNSFLYKLLSLVNDETLPAIRWSQDGEKIIIDNPTKFTAKVLNSYDRKIFKTKNISSFIRQLNLYGFRRVKVTCGKTPIIFKHECFKRGRMDLLADVKRKKPESKSLSGANLITSGHKSSKSTVQPLEAQDRSQVQSKSRYQYLSTAHNYPAYPSQNLLRKNVHMPFITPFAVNPGSTFINSGSNSSMFGKHGEQDQPEITAHSNAQDEETQLLQQPESEKLDKTKIATETFSPWRHHSYQVTQEPATTPMNTAYGNEVGYQVMIQNQVKYANYTPSQSTNYVYSSLPLVTSYRNYGDNPESTYYRPSLMNYNGPANSIVSLPYRTPHMQERSYNNVTTMKSHRSGLKSESFPSCDSRFPEHSDNVFSNANNEAASQCVSHENTAFTYITANDQEK